jgi:hypothetical protein
MSSIIFLANEIQLNELQKLQNRMMRTLLKCRMDTSIWQMSVHQRITHNTMMLLFKIENGLLPNYLCSSLNRVHNTHSHNSRMEEFKYRLFNYFVLVIKVTKKEPFFKENHQQSHGGLSSSKSLM